MKKLYWISVCILICCGVFAGCGTTSLESDESIVYIDKKGSVTFLDIAPFDQDYYSEEELRSEIEETVADYNEENGKDTVTVEELTVEDKTARLKLKYKSVEDYTKMIGVELYQGKVVNALADGYSFDKDFVKVKDGKTTESVEKKEVYGESNLMAVIIRANIDVKVAGEICYVSSENVEVTGKDSVSISGGGNAVETDTYTYIIYK